MTDYELYEYSENKYKEAKKQIEELEKENADLKAKNKWYSEQVCNKECAEVWGSLTKAKDLLVRLSTCLESHSNNNFEYELLKEAEQFLKEIEE